MTLVSSFLELAQQLSSVMTTPTFNTFLTVLTGWVFARRHTITGAILAADAVGTKHHSAFRRLFAKAEWCLDELGLDYRLDITPWAQFTHSTVWAPNIEQLNDYRLTLDTALALPLANSDVWKLKLGIANEYNSDPQPGFDRLDNTYYANIVVEVK